jgi:hypothetical protein
MFSSFAAPVRLPVVNTAWKSSMYRKRMSNVRSPDRSDDVLEPDQGEFNTGGARQATLSACGQRHCRLMQGTHNRQLCHVSVFSLVSNACRWLCSTGHFGG